MKVLAIFSEPQECGDPTLNFVSLDDGKIIKTITMNDFHGYYAMETVTHNEPISEVFTLYDLCVKQRWEINEKLRHLHKSLSAYTNRECTKRLKTIPKEWEDSPFTVLKCEKIEERELPQYSEPDKPFVCSVWKYNVAVCNTTSEKKYCKENDAFLRTLKEETGILWPLEERKNYYSDSDIANYIANKLGYEIVNILNF